MSVPSEWQSMVGEWSGDNRLWLSPEDPVRTSVTTARLALTARGRFLSVRYTWAEGGKEQEGELLIGLHPKTGEVTGAWVDSWHNGDRLMPLRGRAREDGVLAAAGTYPAPPDPDWGWRIELEATAADAFEMRMYNLTPDGEEAPAVSARYARVG